MRVYFYFPVRALMINDCCFRWLVNYSMSSLPLRHLPRWRTVIMKYSVTICQFRLAYHLYTANADADYDSVDDDDDDDDDDDNDDDDDKRQGGRTRGWYWRWHWGRVHLSPIRIKDYPYDSNYDVDWHTYLTVVGDISGYIVPWSQNCSHSPDIRHMWMFCTYFHRHHCTSVPWLLHRGQNQEAGSRCLEIWRDWDVHKEFGSYITLENDRL